MAEQVSQVINMTAVELLRSIAIRYSTLMECSEESSKLKEITATSSSHMSLCHPAVSKHSQNNLQSSTTGIISYMNCVGVGIPLLTFNFQVNKKFLMRHHLKLGQIFVVTSPSREIHHLKLGQMFVVNNPSREILVDAIKEFGKQLADVPATAGGIGLDIARVAQWLLPQPKTVAFLGARASDEDAQALKDLYKVSRVGVRMEELPDCRTGALLVVHFQKKWCEVFFIDSMAVISTAFIDKPVVTQVLERANMIYVTELSVVMNPKISQMLAYYSFSRFKHCLLILHREHLLEECKDRLFEILSYIDIVFLTPLWCRNACSYKDAWDIYLWLKNFAKKSSVVIVSDGLKTAYVHTDLSAGMSAKYKSRYLKNANIVDYYGAARAFVGGFISMMIRGYQIDPCVECGFYCASVIVSRFGLQLPDDDKLVTRWYATLDDIMQRKACNDTVGKRESNMPFTMFQTPWKEKEVNAVFGL